MAKIHPYWLWLLLSVPGLGFAFLLASSSDPRIMHQLVHPTGEFSARFLIIAMMATPLSLLFKRRGFSRWLVKNRRYFGVAAFGYAFFHTVLYLLDKGNFNSIWGEAFKLSIWTGWVAFIIFVPLAFTSFDYFVRRMGRNWKRLQRFTYFAALLTLVHWAALHDWGGIAPALVHFAPLILLQSYRLWYGFRKGQII